MIVDQTTFREALLDPEAPHPSGLLDPEGGPAGRRFDVYRNNVVVSLTEALETAFPVVAKLVGAQNFRTLAGAFLRAHPPSSPLMMSYGAEMPDFLKHFGPTATTRYLPDIARLELGLRASYHAADTEPLGPEALQSVPPDKLMAAQMVLVPSARLIRSAWPVHAIWTYNSIDGAPKPAMAAEDVLILRPDMDPIPFLCPKGSGSFLEAVMDGTRFSEALQVVEDEDFDLSAVLALLISNHAIAELKEV